MLPYVMNFFTAVQVYSIIYPQTAKGDKGSRGSNWLLQYLEKSLVSKCLPDSNLFWRAATGVIPFGVT